MKLFINPCKKRDRQATEEAILTAASHLFAEKGFEATRTLEIAKAAGANEALITRYFGGKDGLLIALMKNQATLKALKYDHALDEFPSSDKAKDLKDGILTFFKNGEKALDCKEEFARIACSRAMVDTEMAEVIRSHVIDEHLPKFVAQLKTYFDDKKVKKSEMEAMAFLIMTVNFNVNFMSRKIYKMDEAQISMSLKILANSIQAYVDAKD